MADCDLKLMFTDMTPHPLIRVVLADPAKLGFVRDKG